MGWVFLLQIIYLRSQTECSRAIVLATAPIATFSIWGIKIIFSRAHSMLIRSKLPCP